MEIKRKKEKLEALDKMIKKVSYKKSKQKEN